MKYGLFPKERLHRALDIQIPSMRWDGKSYLPLWQKNARGKLSELLGLNEIAKYAVYPEIEIEFDRYSEDLDCREIRFRLATEENVTVPCHLCIPASSKEKLPIAITLQGHSSGMHISLGRPKYPGDKEICFGGDRDFAARALREGICAVTMEQRCHGENGGSPETGENPADSCRQPAMRALLLGRTINGERIWDVMRLIDALEMYFSDIVDVDRLICLGNSGGGVTTIYAAALDERIKIAVPSCAVCRYADSIGAMLHCDCNYIPGIAKYFDMGDLCALVAPRNLIVVSGAEDDIFPIDGAKASVEVGRNVFTAYGKENSIVHVIGSGGHRFYADASWPHIHMAIKELY